ncbi:MAG TPA: hypothetical protein PJ988_15270, partial [Anaerolinea sp.]|nr:hypothetical protein [Anaerolinea sp.]
FGLTTWDRQDPPRGKVLRDFAGLLAQMDFSGLKPAPGDAALIVPHEWAKPHGDFSRFGLSGPGAIPYTAVQDSFETGEANVWLTRAWLNSFILARRAGLSVDMPREYTGWQAHPLILLPSPLTSTERNLVHIHTAFWEEVRAYVHAGGLVYASLCADAAIPEMGDLFGASLADHASAGEVTLTFIEPFGDIPAGTVFQYHADAGDPRQWPATLDVNGGQVIARDQNGCPALVAHSYGKGKTLLSAYPLETYLAVMPSAFERPEDTHRIYRGLAQWAGYIPLFSTNNPSVEVAGIVGSKRGYAVLANHSAQKCPVAVTTRLPLTGIQEIGMHGKRPIPIKSSQWEMEIAPYDGAVLEWYLE